MITPQLQRMIKQNKSNIIVFSICLLILTYFMFDTLGYTHIILRLITQPNYLNDFFTYNDNPELRQVSPTLFHFIKYLCTHSYCSFDELVVYSTAVFQVILPLFSVVAGINFYKHYHSIFQMQIVREENYKKYILKTITINANRLAFSIFLSYIFFLIVVYFLSDPSIDIGGKRSFLLDIFGNELYHHKFIYYLLEGYIRFFMMPFVYSFFIQSTVLYFQNIKEVVAVPIVYYYLLTLIGYGCAIFHNNIYVYLSPAAMMANGAFMNINSLLLIFTNSMPFFIGLILIYKKLRGHYEI